MSVGIEAIDSSLRFRSSLEKPNPIPDQNVLRLYPFSDPYALGWHLHLCGLYKGVPPRDDSKLIDMLNINFTSQGHS